MHTNNIRANRFDAIEVLTRDHAGPKAAFKQFKGLCAHSFAGKKKLADKLCIQITKHVAVNFYPAAPKARRSWADLVDEAMVKHAATKAVNGEILVMDDNDDLRDAKLKIRPEQIEHPMDEVESELSPIARKSTLNAAALGRKIAQCKIQTNRRCHLGLE